MFEEFFEAYENDEIIFIFDGSEYDCDMKEFNYIRKHDDYFDIENVKTYIDEYGPTCYIHLVDNRFPWEKSISIWDMDKEQDDDDVSMVNWWNYNGIHQSDFI